MIRAEVIDAIQRLVAIVLFLLAAFAVITHFWGCAAIREAIPNDAKEAAAEDAYLAQHLKCIEENRDMPKAAEDACRANVRRRWCVSDAGAVGCKDGAP